MIKIYNSEQIGILIESFEGMSTDMILDLVECFPFQDMVYINDFDQELIE